MWVGEQANCITWLLFYIEKKSNKFLRIGKHYHMAVFKLFSLKKRVRKCPLIELHEGHRLVAA